MAKDKNAGGDGNSEITFIMFRAKGTNATTQETMRTIQRALENVMQPPLKTLPAASSPKTNGTDELPPEEDPAETDVELSETRTEPRPARRSFGRAPQAVQLDVTKAKVSLNDFLTKKKPGNPDTKRYLAIAVWLKDELGIDEVGIDEIYTCYRDMGWNTPGDASKPLRNLKTRGWMLAGSKDGYFKVFHVGENVVRDMDK